MAIQTADAAAIGVLALDGPRQFQDLFTCIPFTFTFDENSLATTLTSVGDVTVTGAALGDFVLIAARTDLVDVFMSAWVQSANTITVMCQNHAAATNTGRAGNETYNGLILKPRQAWGVGQQ